MGRHQPQLDRLVMGWQMNLATFLDTLTARLGLSDDADFDAMIAALDRLIAMTEKPATRELACVRYNAEKETP